MNTLLKKLNLKSQKGILIINPPAEFGEQMQDFGMFIQVKTSMDTEPVEFALTFCTKLEEIEKWAVNIDRLLVDDGLFWFAYPKGSSKKYTCEFNRDNGWAVLGKLGYEPVRMVAVDEDWSALRFRKAKNIKTLTRDPGWIMSEEGKKKATKK